MKYLIWRIANINVISVDDLLSFKGILRMDPLLCSLEASLAIDNKSGSKYSSIYLTNCSDFSGQFNVSNLNTWDKLEY